MYAYMYMFYTVYVNLHVLHFIHNKRGARRQEKGAREDRGISALALHL